MNYLTQIRAEMRIPQCDHRIGMGQTSNSWQGKNEHLILAFRRINLSISLEPPVQAVTLPSNVILAKSYWPLTRGPLEVFYCSCTSTIEIILSITLCAGHFKFDFYYLSSACSIFFDELGLLCSCLIISMAIPKIRTSR